MTAAIETLRGLLVHTNVDESLILEGQSYLDRLEALVRATERAYLEAPAVMSVGPFATSLNDLFAALRAVKGEQT